MPIYTTWNPADKHTEISLSNGDLTAISTNAFGGLVSARAKQGVSTGKVYWEVDIDTENSFGIFIGIANSAMNLAIYLGSDANGYGYYASGRGYYNGSYITLNTFTTGDIIQIALDLDNGKIWWGKNGTWEDGGDPGAGTGEQYSGITGTWYPACSLKALSEITANFGASAFSYSVPSGFTAGIYEITDYEIILPSPFSSTTDLQSSVSIGVIQGSLLAETSMSIGGLFGEGGWILGKSALFVSEVSLQSDIQIGLVSSPIVVTSMLLSTSEIQISGVPLIATGVIQATPIVPFSIVGTKRIYLFMLTGAANGVEDIIIPISSFQSRIKSGDPTYLSVVIPGTEYASAINARLNGDLIVRMGYQDGNEILLTEIVSRVLFENVTINEGPTNKSITLDGHRTETWMPKTVSLEGASYYNLTKGKLRYRCKPDLYLRPGDIANINDDSFTVESITYSVSPELETYEIAE